MKALRSVRGAEDGCQSQDGRPAVGRDRRPDLGRNRRRHPAGSGQPLPDRFNDSTSDPHSDPPARPHPPLGRRGHTLVELVVALPILAIGGAAVAGLLLSAGVHLLEAERRLATATLAPALLDSLAQVAHEEPAEGLRDIMGRPLHWDWDGEGRLFLHLVREDPSDNGVGGVGHPGTIQWTVSLHGDDGTSGRAEEGAEGEGRR